MYPLDHFAVLSRFKYVNPGLLKRLEHVSDVPTNLWIVVERDHLEERLVISEDPQAALDKLLKKKPRPA